MKHLLKPALLAIAGTALISFSANAATTTYTAGDLLLGVWDDNSQTNEVYEVDLGQISTFENLAGGKSLSFATGTDITNIFGSDFNTDPTSNGYDVTAAFEGTVTNAAYSNNGVSLPAYTTFLSNINTTPLANLSSGQSSTLSGTLQTTAQTGNHGNGVFKGQTINTTAPDSVELASGTNTIDEEASNNAFGYGVDNTTDDTIASTQFNLDVLSPTGTGKSVDIGYFTFGSNGNLTYTSILAAPEPSTYAMFALGLGVLILAARRRMASNS